MGRTKLEPREEKGTNNKAATKKSAGKKTEAPKSIVQAAAEILEMPDVDEIIVKSKRADKKADESAKKAAADKSKDQAAKTHANIDNSIDTEGASAKTLKSAQKIAASAKTHELTPESYEAMQAKVFEDFDAAFRIIFGENYTALDRAQKTFEYGNRSYFITFGPRIK